MSKIRHSHHRSFEKVKQSIITRLLLVSSAGCCDDADVMTGRFVADDDVIFSLHSRQFRTAQVQTSLRHCRSIPPGKQKLKITARSQVELSTIRLVFDQNSAKLRIKSGPSGTQIGFNNIKILAKFEQ